MKYSNRNLSIEYVEDLEVQNQGRGQGRECQARVFISCAVLCAVSVSCVFVLWHTVYHAVCPDIC